VKFKFVLLLLIAVIAAPAATLEYNVSLFDGDLHTILWPDNVTLTVPKFNGPGTLQSVDFELTGSATGTLKYENISTDAAAGTVSGSIYAEVTLYQPDGSTVIVVSSPRNTFRDTGVTAFDGTKDYDGDSGADHSVASLINDVRTATYTSGPNLALFVGSGNIILPVSALSLTGVSSTGGTLESVQSTAAGASLKVTYTYDTPEVPEPGVFAMVGGGLITLGVVFRRRRAHA